MLDKYRIKPCEFSCAQKFLDALDETDERWRGETWLFRGQNVDKCLLPTAMRQTRFISSFGNPKSRLNPSNDPIVGEQKRKLDECMHNFSKDARHAELVRQFLERPEKKSSDLERTSQSVQFPNRQFRINHQVAMERSMYERLWVRAFVNLADQVGLNVPRDSFNEIWNKPFLFPDLAEIAVRSGRNLTDLDPEEFTSIGYALARHHRVPTRLLDFTYRPLVAAFFAAHTDEEKKIGDVDRHIIVWAVSQNALQDTYLKLVKHRRGEIGFLQSQEGAFVLDTLANEKHWFAGDWLPFEFYIKDMVNENKAYKFALSYSLRLQLLKLLALKGISMASLMPSFDNVWRYLSDDQSDFLRFAME